MRLLRSILFLLLVVAAITVPSISQAQIAVGVSVHVGPPALPVYAQPICPGPGYIWTPGYWAYGDDDYYWVPGTWIMPPAYGLLWTPGYWGWNEGVYIWHPGYWGHHVGFYGGINYGFGYTGVGFVGGEWRGRVFHYNTAVTNVNTTIIHNTYHTTVINNTHVVNHVSFNGGPGGISARPGRGEMVAEREHHTPATMLQTQHEHAAGRDRAFRASENHGRPEMAATSRPGEFKSHGGGPERRENPGRNSDRPSNAMNSSNRGGGRDDRPANAHGGGSERRENSGRNSDRPSNAMNSSNRGGGRDDRPANAHGGKPNMEPANSRPNSQPQYANTRNSNSGRDNGPRQNNPHAGGNPRQNDRPSGHQGDSGGSHGEGKPKH
jgi:hypothetical protein